EGDILLVGHPAARAMQLQPGSLDHPAEIDVPEPLGGNWVALLELGDPDPDRGDGVHWQKPLTTGIESLHHRADCPFKPMKHRLDVPLRSIVARISKTAVGLC